MTFFVICIMIIYVKKKILTKSTQNTKGSRKLPLIYDAKLELESLTVSLVILMVNKICRIVN